MKLKQILAQNNLAIENIFRANEDLSITIRLVKICEDIYIGDIVPTGNTPTRIGMKLNSYVDVKLYIEEEEMYIKSVILKDGDLRDEIKLYTKPQIKK